MTDTARLRELVDLFDRSDTHHMEVYAPAGDPSLGLSTEHIRGVVAEVDKMRAVVEAARATLIEWDEDNSPDVDCAGVEGNPPEPDRNHIAALRQALAAMEQNDE